MTRAPLLSAADEVRLARRIERGDLTAKDELVTANLRLVRALAQRYRDRGVPLEDLVQEGAVGLIRAAEKFDHRRGVKFSTYAAWWIRRSIMDALTNERPIRVPHAAQRQLAAVRRAEDDLRRLDGAVVSDDAIAERAELSAGTVRALREAPFVATSLDAPLGEDGTSLGELIPDTGGETALQRTERDESRREMCTRLDLLPARHREVLLRRYGLGRDDAESHEEIAARLGVGEARSRQLESQALHWLRSVNPHTRRVSLRPPNGLVHGTTARHGRVQPTLKEVTT
jgi:RNA polymerase primary sigma factor